MTNIAVIGNAGGGKSTLARHLAAQRGLRLIEIDALLWQPGWRLTPPDIYEAQHAALIEGNSWLIDGLGAQGSIPARLARASEIILVDMPLWVHFWLAAERQIAFVRGTFDHPPAGAAVMPPMRELFRTIAEVEQNWMPAIRDLCRSAEQTGKAVTRIESFEALTAFSAS